MPFDINEFKSNGAQFGFTRPSMFMASIPTPPAFYQGDLRWLSFLCSSTSIPSVRIITAEGKPTGFGMTEQLPYDVEHTNIEMTFYADGEGATISFFDQWLRMVVAHGKEGQPYGGMWQGQVQYPMVYRCDSLSLFQYNDVPGESNGEIIKYSFSKLFPISMTGVSFDWSAGDQIQTFTVTFAFKNFWLQKNEVGKSFFDDISIIFNPDSYDQLSDYGSSNDVAMQRLEMSEARTPGYFGGIPGLGDVLSVIQHSKQGINDILGRVNGFSSGINRQISALGGVASLLGHHKNKLPALPTVRPVFM